MDKRKSIEKPDWFEDFNATREANDIEADNYHETLDTYM
jgi:hypothetical protein